MAYGAPTGLDLSGCNVSTDGGKTSQTLAAVAAAVEGNATAVSKAQEDATDAKTTAEQASDDASDAKSAVESLGDTYIPQKAYMAVNGTVKLDGNGQFVTPPAIGGNAWINLGGYILNADGTAAPDTSCSMIRVRQSVTNSGYTFSGGVNTWPNGTAGYMSFVNYAALHPDTDGSGSLGLADHAWNNIYSKTAVQVTSDMTQKTLIGQVGASTFAEATTLAKALAGVATIGYKLNDAIASKGADAARLHFGYSAQDVWAAIVAAGLDPSKYALITKSPVYVVTDTPTDKKNPDGSAVVSRTVTQEVNAKGNPVYRLMLRYDQIYALLIWYQAQQQASLETRIAALEAKNTASTTTTTTGSAT